MRDFFTLQHSQNIPLSVSVSSTSQFLPFSKAPFPDEWLGPAWETLDSLSILSISIRKNAINVLSLSLSLSVSLPLQTSNNYVALYQGLTFAQLRELRKAALFESCTHQITRNFIHQTIPTSFQQLKVWLYLIKCGLALSSSRYTLHKMVDGSQWRSKRFGKEKIVYPSSVVQPFSILTTLSQLPVWVWRIIHNRILSLDSITASNDFILIRIFVFAVPVLNQLPCDVGWHDALSRCSWSERAHWSRMSVGTEQTVTPSLCGQYYNIVSSEVNEQEKLQY